MASKKNRVHENVSGPYYVDCSCIACRLCTSEAPENFKVNDDDSNAFVYRQPESDEQVELCEDVLDICPVDAIGNDG